MPSSTHNQYTKQMRKFKLFSISFLLSLFVDVLFSIIAFVKECYIPKRDFRLDGFKQTIVDSVRAVEYSAKGWMYDMYSRWHVDSYRIA